MRRMLRLTFVAIGAALFGGASAEETRTIFVTSNGWHTDITLARAEIPAGRIPESADFPDAVYLQFGWGDAAYYTTPDPGIFTTLGAAFPGNAIVHVAGLSARPSAVFRDVEEVALTLSADEFTRLLDYLHASFERDGKPRAGSVAPGVYEFSRFYPATGEFHLFNTCNTWTARGLATAGLDVSADGAQRADDVMRQLRALKAE